MNVKEFDTFFGDQIIGVGAQSTLGEQDIFARKYMHEKLTKCPNFTWYLPEKNNKMPEFYTIFARTNSFARIWGATALSPPWPPVSYAYGSDGHFSSKFRTKLWISFFVQNTKFRDFVRFFPKRISCVPRHWPSETSPKQLLGHMISQEVSTCYWPVI